MKRTVLALFLIFVMLTLFCLSSCEDERNLEAMARCKEEFAQYYSGVDRVAVYHDNYLYFQNHTMKPEDMHSGFCGGTIKLYDGKMYYMAIGRDEVGSKTKLTFYSCDLYGENPEVVHTQTINDRRASFAIGIEPCNSIYLSYINKENGKWVHDQYDVSTGIYETVAVGNKEVSAWTPPADKYQVEIKRPPNLSWIERNTVPTPGEFVITNRETNEQRIIDDQYLENTVYKASMDKFGYGPNNYSVYNGERILLVYDIGGGGGPSKLIFEYNFEMDKLQFLAVIFPKYTDVFRYIYIEYKE